MSKFQNQCRRWSRTIRRLKAMARKMVEPMASTAYRRRGVKIVVSRSLPILGEVLMKQNSLQDILALSTFSINACL